MHLGFSNGEFTLYFSNEKIALKLSSNSLWERVSPDTFKTKSIWAAAKLRQIADEKAERFFKQVFIQRYPLPIEPLPEFLDPHQVEGVNWILTRSRSYLAHAPGAGKTLEAITASLLAQGPGQTLFIVPPTLTVNWAREIIKWTEWKNLFPTIAVVPGSDEQTLMDWDAEFLICSHAMLIRPWVLENLTKRKYKLVAVDEASAFKEADSKKTIALFGGKFQIKPKGSRVQTIVRSSGIVQKAKHAALLDGSPMPNRAMELWAPVYGMAPEVIDFMDQNDYGFKFCGANMNKRGQWEFKGSTNREELKARLQKDFMHVVPESALSHPERKRSMIFMTEDPRTAEQKQWEHKNLKKISFHDLDEDISEGDLARFRRELGINKAPWVANYVNTRLEQNESILLFAWHREVVLRLHAAFKKFRFRTGFVMGGTLDSEREKIFKDFQQGHLRLIIGNIGAMGRGHNLQRADRVVFGEFSWTDELNKQCEKRASRKGSEKLLVPCDYIVAPNSMDEPILSAVFTKAKNVSKVIG